MATNIFRLQAVTWEQSPLHTALYGNTRNRQEGAEMTVDWGDGTVQTNQDITPMHETAKGVYTVTLTYNDKITYYIDGTVIYPTQVLSLVEAVLDESTVIEGNAFRGCWYLTKLTLGATTPPVLGEYAFEGANNLTAIYVPLSAVNAYKTAWANFADKIRGYFPMKTVQSGAHYTTVTVDTAEAVKFSFPSTSLSVEASGGDITVALTDTAQAGDDETITVPDGESRMFIHHRMNVDTYYLTGSGTATLYASNMGMGDVNPFKGGKRGGDGGDYSETVLWEYTGSKPTTMVLSQPVTDFDVIITYGADNGNEYAFQPTVHLVSEIQKGLLFGAGIVNSDARQWYDYVNATTFEINRFINNPYLPIKVVGVKLSSGKGSTGKQTNYSTDEQVIGTWIDGSILYQKTYTGISLNNNSWNNGIIDTAGKTVRDIRGYITTEICTVDIKYYRSGIEFVTIVFDNLSLNILPALSASDFGTLTATITIQYTKSSA